MNSSTSIQSIVTGRLTRFCLPWTKMVMNSCRRFLRARFSAAVSFLLSFPICGRRQINAEDGHEERAQRFELA